MEKLWQIAQKINIDARRVKFSEPMAPHTSFAIGGPADLFIKPSSPAELERALFFLKKEGLPLFILGGGANILVGDKGIRGAVLDMTGLSSLRVKGSTLEAGAGIGVDRLCEQALALELKGLENFYGMPGSLGGAVYMNARCYEKDFSELIADVDAISPEGELRTLYPQASQWAYKISPFQPEGPWAGWILAGASLRLEEGRAEEIARVMRSRRSDRVKKGHYRLPCAGSIFKNNRAFGEPTGVLLDKLGLKGSRIGAAAVSAWHANIFVNEGGASARDMRALIEKARAMALSSYGFALETEVLFVGEF